jgi:alkylation response protein AidB-like acyl-CoA dehydrogenase
MSDIAAPTDTDRQAVQDMLRALRRRHLEPAWEHADRVDAGRFDALWQALAESGITDATLPAEAGGIALAPSALAVAMAEAGAALPALGVALAAHLVARALLAETATDAQAPDAVPADARLALSFSPLDVQPATGYTLSRQDKGWKLGGRQRVMVAPDAHLLVAARGTGGLLLCLLDPAQVDAQLREVPSSHGLCLLRFGELACDALPVGDVRVFEFPDNGACARLADGLLAALMGGMLDELARRAADYARERVQAGKPISEHHAVQQMIGPIELARRAVRELAVATLRRTGAGDGSTCAFAMPLLRRSALDAIQVFGGYGYMQDYRVERYLRDANTLETFWIHAGRRERELALARCALPAGEEAA